MKKFSQNFVMRSEYLYELAERVGYFLDDYLCGPEDRLTRERLVNIFRVEFIDVVNKQANEDKIEKCFVGNALVNYITGLSFINGDAITYNFINDFAPTNYKDYQ